MSNLHTVCEGGGFKELTTILNADAIDSNNSEVTSGSTPLHIAAGKSNATALSHLLKFAVCDPNAQNEEGDTPLHIAVKNRYFQHKEIVFELIFHGECNPNVHNTEGDTPLHIGVRENKIVAVSQLIADQRCDLNAQNNEGNTPLHIACCSNFSMVIRLLLERRCSTNIPNKKGETAQEIPITKNGDCLLHLACQWGDVGIVRHLVSNQRCNPNVGNSCMNTPLHTAVKHYQNETIVELLSCEECNPNVRNREGDTPLHIGVRQNYTAALLKLLAHEECNPNAQNNEGNTPLHIACCSNFSKVIRLLLERCSTNIPNKKGETAQEIPITKNGDCLLHLACQRGDVGIVRHLVSNQRCNPNVGNSCMNTPLHTAVKHYQNETIVELLSCEECNPNVRNREGDTPLHIAVKHCQNETIVELLSCEECNPNVRNREGDTPLHIGVRQNYTAALLKLLAHEECDQNAQNIKGNTPLHIACCSNFSKVIRLLLERRCRTNIPNKKGETAQEIPIAKNGDRLLHLACQWGDVGIVRHLVSNQRCNPNVGNSCINTPLHTAVKHCQNETIVELLSCEECNPNVRNREGDTPLHIGVRQNNTAALFKLLAHEECNPNAQNIKGNTPLHIACCSNFSKVIRLLLERRCSTNIPNKKGETAQEIPITKDGDCLLHLACQWGDVGIVKHLIANQQCDLNAQNKEGNTPLHTACCSNFSKVIRLLLERKCSTNIPNKKGETAQGIPITKDGDCLLHLACQWGDVGIVKHLVSNQRCNPNVGNSCMNTPLHTAVKHCQNETIVELLSCEECNPNAQNREGDTPLHIAVKENKTAALSQLLALESCDPNAQNKEGDTPLHIVVREDCMAATNRLLAINLCDPNIENRYSNSPLHVAVAVGNPLLCKLIMGNAHCDVNTLNRDHLTPLLAAIKQNKPSVATALLQHRKCDLSLRDPDGNTALHLACIGGETQPEMVKIAKQLLNTVDPSPVNIAGQTPIELTTNYQLIQAISHFTLCKTKHSVQTYINIFIVGNPGTGKTTLVEAIIHEAGYWWRIVPKFMRIVRNVPPHTAGIIPTTFQSKAFGNTILYDLAGQIEYYTSHAAVIQTTVISTPPAFIIVVNMSESEEKISKQLRYWKSFIKNHAAHTSAPPQVILVGSHADKVEASGGNVQEKMSQMSALLQDLPSSFHFAGQVALDCRDPASSELQFFCSLVKKSCVELRPTADVDLHCHVLYAFLLETFPGKVACNVSDIIAMIQDSDALLPQNPDGLIPFISTLSDKGLLLLVRDNDISGDSWVILQKQALISDINGSIFAPQNFSQHKKDLFSSTGVVPLFKLKKEFPQYNTTMIAKFLTHLEFCFKIDDHETLELLKDDVVHEENMPQEEYYFFPALVNVENPLHVWEQDDVMISQCGWFYQCVQPDQFLTTSFLHLLILRLAYSFALKRDPSDSHKGSLTLHRRCSVWKNGIGWLNRVPIETVVEVGLSNQSVVVMMRCPKGEETKCAQLRSDIIQKVLEVKDEQCKSVEVSESFIHPTDVKYPVIDNTKKLKYYFLTEIASATINKEANVLDYNGLNPYPIKDLLLFDPQNITSRELLSELFSEKHSLDEQVRGQVLEKLLKATPHPAITQERGQVGEAAQELKKDGVSQHCTKPTLQELLKFTCTDGRVINIPVEIATKYVQFGTYLLEDRNGSRVKIMAHKLSNDAERINTEILQQWLTGGGKQPVTWETLVEVLHDIELVTLASDISTSKCPSESCGNA